MQINNPIPAVLELIPYSDSVLDVMMLDNIAITLLSSGYTHISNSIIMILLVDLEKAGLITLTQFEWPSTLGKVYIIKKVLNG